MNTRKYDLDHLRYFIVLLVVFYHVFYLLNSVGVISNIDVQGIPQLDVVEYFIYPWFMICMFVIAGISARYALQKKTGKQFLKDRTKKLLLPSLGVVFLIGWIAGYVTGQYSHFFDQIPIPDNFLFHYLFYCLNGIGPMWFVQELFLATVVLLIIRKLDKKERLTVLAEKVTFPILLLLVIPIWGSSMILNTPLITVYRNGIYLFTFLLGYYVLSLERIMEQIERAALYLLSVAIILGVIFTVTYWGQNYTESTVLTSLLTNCYAWSMTLALLGCFRKWFSADSSFSRYMRTRSFPFYVLHIPILVLSAYLLDQYTRLPVWSFYPFLLLIVSILLPVLTEILTRIPVVKTLLFGL